MFAHQGCPFARYAHLLHAQLSTDRLARETTRLSTLSKSRVASGGLFRAYLGREASCLLRHSQSLLEVLGYRIGHAERRRDSHAIACREKHIGRDRNRLRLPYCKHTHEFQVLFVCRNATRADNSENVIHCTRVGILTSDTAESHFLAEIALPSNHKDKFLTIEGWEPDGWKSENNAVEKGYKYYLYQVSKGKDS